MENEANRTDSIRIEGGKIEDLDSRRWIIVDEVEELIEVGDDRSTLEVGMIIIKDEVDMEESRGVGMEVTREVDMRIREIISRSVVRHRTIRMEVTISEEMVGTVEVDMVDRHHSLPTVTARFSSSSDRVEVVS